MKVYIKSSTERTFRDTESGDIITISELRSEYEELYRNGEVETDTFEGYLNNCLSKNGFLEEITASVGKKMSVNAASSTDTPLDDNITDLKADFDYVLDGLEKLGRMGSDKSKGALSISLELSDMLNDINNEISNLMID